jgi:hypothetical protein
MRSLKIMILLLTFLVSGSVVHAAPFTQTFLNDYQTDSIFLFITDVDLTDGDTTFSKWQKTPKNWVEGFNEPDKISVSGPQINPGEEFRVKFDNRGTFTLEWAELLKGSIQGSGSIYFDNGSFAGVSDNFTSAVPINGSLWLLGSGLVCLMGIRRKMR